MSMTNIILGFILVSLFSFLIIDLVFISFSFVSPILLDILLLLRHTLLIIDRSIIESNNSL